MPVLSLRRLPLSRGGKRMFEVKRGHQRLFWTEEKSCIPNKATRKQMRATGLRLYMNGKPFTENGGKTV